MQCCILPMKEAKNEIHISLHVFALNFRFNFATEVARKCMLICRVFVRNWLATVKKKAVYLRCVISSKKYALKEFQKRVSQKISKKTCEPDSPATRLEKCSLSRQF